MQLIRLDTSSLFSDDTYNHKKQIKLFHNILNGKKIEKNIIIPISLINKENLFKYDEDRWQ